jgi:DNA helicase-2/ATP-dependent DNA helicase PcrA
MPDESTLEFLKHLNAEQYRAVTAGEGPILVLAGPGSGKTRVLTQRIAYLVKGMGVRPHHILAVTFTNKAAREMQHRLEGLLGEQAQYLWLGTFHAICARILRREAAHLPFDHNFVIMDADDQIALVRQALKALNLDEKLYRPAGIHATISMAKNNLIGPDEFTPRTYRDEIVKRVYQRYQEFLRANNAVDFDDLLIETVRLLRDNPPILERYAGRFEHVLVDEFQDTNLVQYELLKLLASVHQNVFVVGDEDQSIYRWRGADYRNVLRFESEFPNVQKILLQQNYRSTQTVLDAAQGVINRNHQRTPKKLFSDRGRGDPIILYEAVDEFAEAAFVVDTIRQWIESGKAKGSDFAVMYRTNAQSRLLEEAFLRAGIPYHLVGAQRFYGRREVKDVIAFLRLAQNPEDEISLLRVINVPPRGVGEKTLVALQLLAREAHLAPGRLLIELGEKGHDSPYWTRFPGRSAMLLADFGALLAKWHHARETLSLIELFDRILTDIGYEPYINDGSEEGQDRWENVQELRRLAFEYRERGLSAFLEDLALVSDQDTLPQDQNAPTLLTLHAAKGLEFPQVFIVGLDEGLLPHTRSRDDPEELAEERRLFYVGLTRAKDRLYLVRALRRSSFGYHETQEPSRFLEDIDERLIRRQGYRPTRATSTTWTTERTPGVRTPPSPAHAAILQPRYRPGQRVRHPSWGEGMVVDSRVQEDGEETVDVFFESVGFKRVIASIARLEAVNPD